MRKIGQTSCDNVVEWKHPPRSLAPVSQRSTPKPGKLRMHSLGFFLGFSRVFCQYPATRNHLHFAQLTDRHLPKTCQNQKM
jgi:hypothetical protein